VYRFFLLLFLPQFYFTVVLNTEFQDPLFHKGGDTTAIPQHAHKVDKLIIGRFCRKLLD